MVTVPVLFKVLEDTVEIVIPLAMLLLLLSTKLPVPVTPPETVNKLEPLALLFVNVVPLELTVIADVVIDKADVALFSIICVTFDPTPPLIKVTPDPVPLFVTVPALLSEAVEMVMPFAVVVLLLSTKLPVPVTPPDTVNR